MTASDLTICIPHHLPECRPYLDACLRSVLADPDGRAATVVVVADTPEPPAGLPAVVRLVHDRSLDSATKKGIHAARFFPSRYFLGGSDDVVFGHRAIGYMVEAAARLDDLAVVAPDSNGENSTLHVRRAHSFPQTTDPDPDFVARVIGWEPVASDALAIAGMHLAFHAVLIPARVFAQVGTADPQFAGAFDDTDFLLRCRIAGIPAVLAQRAYTYHFGSQTLSRTGTRHAENQARFLAKWRHRPDLLALL